MIYFGGDSWTTGDELTNPKSSCFASLIGNNYNMPIVNDGTSGGSNQRIVRKFFENINKEHKLIIISWTIAERFEGFYAEDNSTNADWSNLSHSIIDYELANSFLKSERRLYKGFQTYLNHVRTSEYVLAEHLTYIQQIQKFCVFSQIPYIMTFVYPYTVNEYLPRHCHIKKTQSFKKIDWSNNTWLVSKKFNFRDYSLDQKYKFGPKHHVLEDGHRSIADLFIEKIDTQSLLKR